MQEPKQKLLVYLDQNYVSSMVKESLGRTHVNQGDYGQAVSQLLETFKELVDRDLVLCPESTVHDQESGFDQHLAKPAHKLLKELSGGVSFQTYVHIEMGQVLRALHRYLGLEIEPEDGRWQHAYYSDPQAPIRRPRVYAHIATPDEFVVEDQRRKDLIQSHRTKSLNELAQKPQLTFREIKQEELVGIAIERYRKPAEAYLARLERWASGSESLPTLNPDFTWNDFIDYCEQATIPPVAAIMVEYERLTQGTQLATEKPFWYFFVSPEFARIPYYDICTSVVAGFRFHKPQRSPRASDPYDLVALSSVLPYVDVVTTDGEMKDMVKRLKLHGKYGVEVYSAGKRDIQALTKRLLSIGSNVATH